MSHMSDTELRVECAKAAAHFFAHLRAGVTVEQACNWVYEWVTRTGDNKE